MRAQGREGGTPMSEKTLISQRITAVREVREETVEKEYLDNLSKMFCN